MIYPFTNFIGCNHCIIEVWEWISNFIPHFTVNVITYQCWQWTICPPFPGDGMYPDSKVHGANMGHHLGPVGPRWAPWWPHEPCYQSIEPSGSVIIVQYSSCHHNMVNFLQNTEIYNACLALEGDMGCLLWVHCSVFDHHIKNYLVQLRDYCRR